MNVITDKRLIQKFRTDPDISKDVAYHTHSPRRMKFKKIYKAPGYPVDPKLEQSRALDAYVNAFAPQLPRVFNSEPLNRWLNQNIN